eukprot:jgi/Psemu1/203987/e_gw1.337.38.1
MKDPYFLFYTNQWTETWEAFNLALRSTEDFNAFRWILILSKAGICSCYFKCGLYKSKIHIYWRSWVPAFAIVLISSVIASYYGSLREFVKERWCHQKFRCQNSEINHGCEIQVGGRCQWLLFHDVVVAYLGTMIIFNFLSACFRSPGVLSRESKHWSSKDSRGGFCGIDPILNISQERLLLRDYYNIGRLSKQYTNDNESSKRKGKLYFPDPEETFCKKCNSSRPPRCHHCSICNRCILQFDHHCVWLNNCVGYNNHRAFLLTLFYLSVGCCYGWFMLYRPFLEQMNTSSDGVGWQLLHDNISALLNLPSATTILSKILIGTLEKDTVLVVVFPFLTAIGLLQTIFLGYHLMYVVSALTTLENKILLDMQYKQILNESTSYTFPQNPFSRGWLVNLKNVLGPIPLVFLPIQVNPKEVTSILDVQRIKGT